MPAEAVTLNRDDVLELLVEANKVADVVEALSDTCPTRLTGPLVEMAPYRRGNPGADGGRRGRRDRRSRCTLDRRGCAPVLP